MCGINGIFSNSFTPEELKQNISLMNDAIIHRGPDSDGVYIDKGMAFGFRRLSIIDLSPNGDQPMISSSGRYVIIFNGEIYNFPILKQNLVKDFSINFRGTSDTEVFLCLIENYGLEETLGKVQGMFGFSLYDTKENIVHLCRDRLGEKPLYYSLINQELSFSSELKPLTNLLKGKLNLDIDNINFFITKSYFPEGASVFKEVQKVIPGTVLSFNLKENKVVDTSVHLYWSFQDTVDNSIKNPVDNYDQAKKYLDDLLDIKVKERMISDVPLGAFLSGGYDSSLIVALMQKNSLNKIKTFSIGFHSAVHNEAEEAKRISDHIGTDHQELYVSDKELLDTIYRLPSIYSEPFADSSQIPTVLLADLTKSEVTVSLSGDGGDEIFGGYGRYFLGQQVIDSLGKIPFPIRRSLKSSGLINNSLIRNISNFLIGSSVSNFPQKFRKLNNLLDFRDESELYEILSTFKNNFLQEPLKQPLSSNDIWKRDMTYAEKAMMQDTIDYLPGDILKKVDQAGMSASLETRIPFLDHEIISYAWRLPFEYKYKNGSGKHILKEVAHNYIPKSLLDRPKKGFDIPLSAYLRNELKDYSLDVINSSRSDLDSIFDFKNIDLAYDSHLSQKEDNSNLLWNAISFFAWYEEYIK
jgi:asparagine synthase (glutamine-hydrolysing)